MSITEAMSSTLEPKIRVRTVNIGRLRLRTFKVRTRPWLDHHTAANDRGQIMGSALHRRWWQSGEIVLIPHRLVSWHVKPKPIEAK